MKNITNLDIKRNRLGLTQELSSFAILSLYKKSTIKLKLEILAVVEVIKYNEKNYKEALGLIFKLEKATSIQALITKLSKLQLETKTLASKQRQAIAKKREKKSKIESKYKAFYKSYKSTVIGVGGFLIIVIASLLLNPVEVEKIVEKEKIVEVEKPIYINGRQQSTPKKVIYLTSNMGQKYISSRINGISTTFMLDTGASDILLSKVYISQHVHSGYLNRSNNYVGRNSYYTADGSIVIADLWKIPSIKIGSVTIYNVIVAAVDGVEDSVFLFGMSALEKMGKTTIDLKGNKILIE